MHMQLCTGLLMLLHVLCQYCSVVHLKGYASYMPRVVSPKTKEFELTN